MCKMCEDFVAAQRPVMPPADAETMAETVQRMVPDMPPLPKGERSTYGPRMLARRLSDGELSDRLRLLAIHPRRFTNEENIAVIEEAAERLDKDSER